MIRHPRDVMRALGVVVLVGTTLAARVLPAAERAGPAAASAPHVAHLERGIRLYDAGQLDDAILELTEARHLATPDVAGAVCYALGQALRRRGLGAQAIEAYRCAADHAVSEAAANAARFQIGRCVTELPSSIGQPSAAPTALPQATSVSPAQAPRAPAEQIAVGAPPAPPVRWWRDAAGGALLGVGLGASLAGAVLLGHAERLAIDSSADLGAYRAAGAVGAERIAGAVTLGAGGLLVLGAITRYAVIGARGRRFASRTPP